MSNKALLIRNIYLYLVSATTLFMITFAVVNLINIGLRTWIFPKADQSYSYPKARPDFCSFDKDGKQICPSEEEINRRREEDKKAEIENAASQKQREIVQDLSMLIVAIPLFTYHWFLVRRERKELAD